MDSEDTLVGEEHFLEDTFLEDSYDVVIVASCDVEVVDPISSKSPTKPIPTSIVLPYLPPILFALLSIPQCLPYLTPRLV